MRLARRMMREKTNPPRKNLIHITDPVELYYPVYGKTTYKVGGKGAPGNATVPGNYAGMNPAGGSIVYNPGSGGNWAGSNPGSFFHNANYNGVVYYATPTPPPSPYSSGNTTVNYSPNQTVTNTAVFDQPGPAPSPYTNYGPDTVFTANFAYSGMTPGTDYYNPYSPGNIVYNPPSGGNYAGSNPGLYGYVYTEEVYTVYVNGPVPAPPPFTSNFASQFYSVFYTTNSQFASTYYNNQLYSTSVPSPSYYDAGGPPTSYQTRNLVYTPQSYTPGSDYYNPPSPGNPVYNGTPATPYYNPATPGNAGTPVTVFGVLLPGAPADTPGALVPPVPAAVPFSEIGISILVPAGGCVDIENL